MPDIPLVKICGLTDPAEAAACAQAGAWAIGLVFAAESPRYVTVEGALAVSQALPDAVKRFGVFVTVEPDDAAEIAAVCRLTHIQVHDRDADIAELRQATGCAVVQGVAVSGADDLAFARSSEADLVLVDASVPGRHGGTGRTFNWDLLRDTPLDRPFLLAGGLTPENVGEAVSRVAPAFVDTSTGVESAPGRKDLARVAAFIAAARGSVVAA